MKMKILLAVIFTAALFSLQQSEVYAAPQCSGNTNSYSVACWTELGTPGYWGESTCVGYWDCSYDFWDCGTYYSAYNTGSCKLHWTKLCKDGCGHMECTNPGYGASDGAYSGTFRTPVWIPGSYSQTCHYWEWDGGYETCSGNWQDKTGGWTTKSGSSCSNEYGGRYCCDDPACSISAPGTVDAEDNFSVDWTFTNTDPANGYNCEITDSGYDLNIATSVPLATPNFGLNTGSHTGYIEYPGPNPSFTHGYTITCTHPEPGCPGTASTTNVSVTPTPLSANIIVNPNPAEIVETVQWTANVSGGAPFPGGDYKIDWDNAINTDGWYTDASVRYVLERYGILGIHTAELTAEDSWGNTATTSKTVTVQDSRKPQ